MVKRYDYMLFFRWRERGCLRRRKEWGRFKVGYRALTKEEWKRFFDIEEWFEGVFKKYEIEVRGVTHPVYVNEMGLRFGGWSFEVLAEALGEVSQRMGECPHLAEDVKEKVRRVIEEGIKPEGKTGYISLPAKFHWWVRPPEDAELYLEIYKSVWGL